MEERIVVISKEIREKAKVFPRYILLKCDTCGSTWGVYLEERPDQALSKRDMICRNCALEAQADKF